MEAIFRPCKSISLLNSSYPSLKYVSAQRTTIIPTKNPKSAILQRCKFLSFCSRKDVLDSTQLRRGVKNGETEAYEELELRNKPSPVSMPIGSSPDSGEELEEPDNDEVLAPFLKFFKSKDPLGENYDDEEEDEEEENSSGEIEVSEEISESVEENRKVNVEYYDPKAGDFVVGVVVSGNENKLDVNIGADLLGTMLTKEVLPLYDEEMDFLLCDLNSDAEDVLVSGKMGLVKYDGVLAGRTMPGRPVVETGTVLFAEVLGRTLSGRPLLSTRRLFRRIAWHRVRQIKELNEPIGVKIIQWNTGGLLTRIEGLRAFIPKAELLNRANNFTELKENVGRRTHVVIRRIDEAKNDLILSEREAWEMRHLREGTLLDGTISKIFPYGAQIRIAETNRSGLLHISNITRARVSSVIDVLAVGEKVKVLVVKSMFPEKISLSIADLESEPGLFLSNKEKVFAEAEQMASKYRRKLQATASASKTQKPPTTTTIRSNVPFDSESIMYANWNWFKFEKE